ncbi:MAG: hypothetical protein JGK21_31900 [Microcoleus sp. PH2017_22_RUC_O_B]|uniref:hypothetical protein n=1 Tax=unclassified Microcoleus TaxID=2642155 RepID=UPI001E03822B|nr:MULTISPECIES: hypothetical protein [unclassified Microcoleus]MCC3532565.1 hypothetical protein [Microcoleus sp. PH2017_21_RUC_O_A]MCC3544829.1 hypothetical protein [Microcoleus sp. PH2017_22_RUC_O_B]
MRQDEKRCEHAIATCSEKVFKLQQVSKWEWEETFPFSSESCANSALKYAMKRLYLEPPQHRHFRAFKPTFRRYSIGFNFKRIQNSQNLK